MNRWIIRWNDWKINQQLMAWMNKWIDEWSTSSFEKVRRFTDWPDHPSNHLQFSGCKYIPQLLLLQIRTVELMPWTNPHPIPSALRQLPSPPGFWDSGFGNPEIQRFMTPPKDSESQRFGNQVIISGGNYHLQGVEFAGEPINHPIVSLRDL